jgi:hypothetical protein
VDRHVETIRADLIDFFASFNWTKDEWDNGTMGRYDVEFDNRPPPKKKKKAPK